MSNVEPLWRLYNFKNVFDGQCAGQKESDATWVIRKYIYNIIEIPHIN